VREARPTPRLQGVCARRPLEAHDYKQLRDRLEATLRQVCPPWLSPHLDDLVQLAAIRVHQTYDGAEINGGLLYRVAQSVVIDEIRRQRRRQEILMTPTTPERVAGPSHHTPEALAHSESTTCAIQGCLHELPDDRRRAVDLYLQGHSVPESAALLGFDQKKTENLVYRGLADLRVRLERLGVLPR